MLRLSFWSFALAGAMVFSSDVALAQGGLQLRERPDARQAQPAREAEPIDLKTGLNEGRTTRYEVRRNMEFAQKLAEAEPDEAVTSTTSHMAGLVITVERGLGENQPAIVLVEIESFEARVSDDEGATAVAFDFAGDAEAVAAAGGGVDALAAPLRDAEIRLTVDEVGNVGEVSGLENLYRVYAQLDDAPEGLLGFMDEESFPRLMSKLFNAEGGVEHSKTGGQGAWSTTEEVSLDAAGTLMIARSWTPSDAEMGLTTLTGNFALRYEAPPAENASAPDVAVETYRGEGRVIWDAKHGGLNFLTTLERLQMQWTMGSMSLDTQQVSGTIIRRIVR
jgi:hypothetical protein